MAWNVGLQITYSIQICLIFFKVECCRSFFSRNGFLWYFYVM